MSRFNNPKALSTLLTQPVRQTSVEDGPPDAGRRNPYVGSPAAAPGKFVPTVVPRQANAVQQACFYTLCAYLLSGFANEFATRLFHGKAYLSTVTVVVLPLLFVATGDALRGAQVAFGKWWIGFGIWLSICAPFSVWKSDTLKLLENYYFRSFILYFVICACVLTLRRLRSMMFLLGFANFLVVLTCWKFGSSDGIRFSVQDSIFSTFSNSNELAMQLLLGIVVLLFPLSRPGVWNKFASLCMIALSVFYMLKTGSRGVLLGVVVTTLAFLILSRKRMQALVVLLPLSIVILMMLPARTRHRLTNVAIGDDFTVASKADESDLGSQLQREQLFKNSVRMTFEHPIFGVGPGEFVVADSGPKSKAGAPAAWRQTHNSYTQVSSEAGLPGFILYLGSILLCLGMSYRCYRQTVDRRGLEDYAGISFCMVLSIVAYAICTIFDHLAYTGFLPTIAGVTTATHLAARDAIAALKRQEL